MKLKAFRHTMSGGLNIVSSLVHSFTGVENSTCVGVTVAACDIGEFTCIRDRSCTDIHKVCDGQVNCADGSDELDCGKLLFVEPFTPKLVTIDS